MREVLVVPPEAVKRAGRVRKVQFGASGAELAAWVEPRNANGYELFGLYCCDLSTGQHLGLMDYRWYSRNSEIEAETLLSPSTRWLVTWAQHYEYNFTLLHVDDASNPSGPVREHYVSGIDATFVFAPGNALLAVFTDCTDEIDFVARVVQLDTAKLDKPKRTVKRINPFTQATEEVPVWDFKWKRLLTGEWEGPVRAALSANGRFLAVADEPGNVHVADLKRKRVVAVHEKARLTADRAIARVVIDDTGERVFRTANGVLHGPDWQFKPRSGKPTDFALSPDQRTVCAVFDTGHTRTFDAATGAVRKELRWGKKALYSVCFAPDGLTCAAGSSAGRVILWDVDG
jgi:WD40 repeat protein